MLQPITLVEGNPYAVLTFDRNVFIELGYLHEVISWEVFHGNWVLVEGNRYSLLEQGFLYITNVSIVDAGVYRVNIYYFTNCHIVQVRKVNVGNTMLSLPTMTEVCNKLGVIIVLVANLVKSPKSLDHSKALQTLACMKVL